MSEGHDRADTSDPGSVGAAGDGVSQQLSQSDMLEDRNVADLLDEGYSPPDREPSVRVPTESEERRGETLDQRLAEEEPDGADPDGPVEDRFEVGDRRSGRLTDAESDGISDVEKDLVAEDVGVDGAAASAEEAAVHLVDGQPERNEHPDGDLIDEDRLED